MSLFQPKRVRVRPHTRRSPGRPSFDRDAFYDDLVTVADDLVAGRPSARDRAREGLAQVLRTQGVAPEVAASLDAWAAAAPLEEIDNAAACIAAASPGGGDV